MPPATPSNVNVFDEALHLLSTSKKANWHTDINTLIRQRCQRCDMFTENYVSILPLTSINNPKQYFFKDSTTSICAVTSRDRILIVDPNRRRALELAYSFGVSEFPGPILIKTKCQFSRPDKPHFEPETSYHRRASIQLLEKMNVPEDTIRLIRPRIITL